MLPRARAAEPNGVEQAALGADVLGTTSTSATDHCWQAFSLREDGRTRDNRGGGEVVRRSNLPEG